MVGEAELGVELFGFDQKASAVRLPLRRFHGADPSEPVVQSAERFSTSRSLVVVAGFRWGTSECVGGPCYVAFAAERSH
jgi:hypothetical protein